MPRPVPDPALSATVRRLREEQGVSREVFAVRAGLTTGTLHKIETGQSSPSWSSFRQIAAGLGWSITELAGAVQATEKRAQESGS